MCTDLSSLIGIFDPQRGERGPEGTESIEQSLKESEEIRIHLKYNSNIYTRVAPIWKKVFDFKSGLRIFVVLPKDPKNALKSIVG